MGNNKILNIFKIIMLFILSLYFIESFAGDADTIRNSILPTGGDSINAVNRGKLAINSNNLLLDSLLNFIKDSIFSLISLIAIGVFIFVGAKLVVARGNPEEFKKAVMSFIYAIVGLFIVSISWGLVKLITGIDIR